MYNWSKLLVILVYVMLTISNVQPDKRYVTKSTTYGLIRGYIHVRPNGDEVERYLGVPYASPPVGRLRFQLPVAPSVWRGVRDTTAEPYACVQSKSDVHYIKQHNPGFHGRMTEDCLHVNVYVPVRTGRCIHLRQTIQENSLPVLVHIHGGSNEAGMGAMLHSDTLASEGKMIVVTMNYRLGVLGFLSVPHMNIPGNYGLYDQTMALSWVQQNIAFFGGDPARVTVQGHSAGGVDAGFHLLSPLSKGLFRYAILMSGSPTAYWALTPPTDPKEESMGPNSHLITLGCYFKEDASRTRTCLENFNMSILIDLSFEHPMGFYDFSPVVDGTFVTRDPKQGLGDLVNAKSVMIGLVKDEGSLTVDVILKNERQVHRSGTYLTESQILQDYYNYIQVPSHFNHSLYREYASPYVQPYVSYFQPLKGWS
ncbi:Neuroligin-4, X-linked [Bulinus truncatus]|nr:Neuroligin-4, X-linked [Bulinus truncatus]